MIFLAMSRNILEYVEFFGLGQSDLGILAILGILGNLGILGILGALPGKSWNSRELPILGAEDLENLDVVRPKLECLEYLEHIYI